MLYSNVALEATEKEFPWGERVNLLVLGAKGWGCKELLLLCEPGTKIIKGLNSFSVELTERGVPRVVPEMGDTWVLLDSIGGNPSNGEGWLYIPESQNNKVEIISKGRVCIGDKYTACGWCSYLLRPKDNQPFQIVIWEAGWPSNPLDSGSVVYFDPDLQGQKVRMVSLADAILIPYRFCGEIEETIAKHHQIAQRDLSSN